MTPPNTQGHSTSLEPHLALGHAGLCSITRNTRTKESARAQSAPGSLSASVFRIHKSIQPGLETFNRIHAYHRTVPLTQLLIRI